MRHARRSHIAIDFVRAYLQKTCSGRKAPHRVQEHECPVDVRVHEGSCLGCSRAVYVGFRSKVNQPIDALNKAIDGLFVSNIIPHPRVAGRVLKARQIFGIPRLGEKVEIDHLCGGVPLMEQADEARANEAAPAGDQHLPRSQCSSLIPGIEPDTRRRALPTAVNSRVNRTLEQRINKRCCCCPAEHYE